MGQIRNVPAARDTQRASMPNLIFTGILMSAALIATASPTLARQFTIAADLTVTFIMFAYIAACVSLLRMSGAFPPKYRIVARALGLCGAVFCVALIAESEADLLIWSVLAIALAALAYGAVWLRRGQPLKTAAGA